MQWRTEVQRCFRDRRFQARSGREFGRKSDIPEGLKSYFQICTADFMSLVETLEMGMGQIM